MTNLRAAAQQALEALEGVVSAHAYGSGTPVEAITALRAALDQPERRLTDDEIGRIWFKARIPGVTETSARILIRMAEELIRVKGQGT